MLTHLGVIGQAPDLHVETQVMTIFLFFDNFNNARCSSGGRFGTKFDLECNELNAMFLMAVEH